MSRKGAKENNPLVRFELGCGGLLGLGVVVFCIFLWMYLFGVWTGQSGLQSTLATGDPRELVSAATKILQGAAGPVAVTPAASEVTAGDEAQGQAPASARQETTSQPSNPPPASKIGDQAKDENAVSFFAIQVAAFRDEQRALKSVVQWRAREYEAFYLQPEAEGNFYRVLVGHFDSLAEANGLAATLEASQQNKVFISLVSENQQRYPASN